jgi:hypothetical protein
MIFKLNRKSPEMTCCKKEHKMRLLVLFFIILFNVVSYSQAPEKSARIFTVRESFGVSHPDQIVTFDLNEHVDTAKNILIAENDKGEGAEVPYQLLDDGKLLAIRVSLAANETKKFRLQPGIPRVDDKNAVTVSEKTDYIEIASDSVAVRIPNFATPGLATGYNWAKAPTRPMLDLFNYGPDSQWTPRQVILAPVQGVRLHDGTWSGLGPNMMVALAKSTTSASVKFVERGPLKVVAQVSYRFDKPSYDYGPIHLSDAGPGYYTCTIVVESGQPSILFEEDTDLEMIWGMNLYNGLSPDQARYRGHHANSVKSGRWTDGTVYKGYQYGDATVDLQYKREQTPSYNTTEGTWRYMSVWDPWAFDTGWYWQAYNSEAGEDANIAGLFAGSASRAIGAAMSGASIFTLPADPRNAENRVFGIAVQSYRRSPDNRKFPRSRFQWGLYLASKKALPTPDKIQPINLQMNIHGGINLDKVNRWSLDFPDLKEGYGTAFMGRAGIDTLKKRVKTEPAYYSWLYNNDTYTRALFDSWRETGREKLTACVNETVTHARDMLNSLVNKGGIYEMSVHYWHGGLEAQRYGVWIDQLLGDPRITDEERIKLKAAAVMFANVVWDDDHAPISTTVHGLNLGTENMPIQQWGYRRFYALFMANHPTMTERSKLVESQLKQTIDNVINDSGAEIGCPHYIGASFVPTLNTLLQVKQIGKTDPFKEWPKLAKFANFYLNLQTPPEPRMGKKPAIVPLGDSGLETSETFGLLGTGFRDADPELSKRLMGAWAAGGKQHSFFFGTTTVMIDDSLPTAPAPLSDADFPGYYSVLRHGWNTLDETTLFFVNGDFYRDHRHYDHGSIVLYALGKPISTDWSAIYTPHAPGAYMHSMVVPEASIGHAWDKDGALLTAGNSVWGNSRREKYESANERSYVQAKFSGNKVDWTRAVTTARPKPDMPVIVIHDSFSGEKASESKVMSLNLMAVGPVVTPAGEIEPVKRTHPVEQRKEDPTVLPSASKPIDLAAGVNEFGFTGRYDVDFAVFIIGDVPQQALIGNWADTAWGGNITEREERQHILRIRGTGSFTTILVPWRRGHKPEKLTVTVTDGVATVKTVDSELKFDIKLGQK